MLVEVHPSPLCTCIEERDTEDTRVIGEEEREGGREREGERERRRKRGGREEGEKEGERGLQEVTVEVHPSPLCTCIQ